MSKQVQLRRGTTAEYVTFTGAEGEATFDTTKKTIVVHDGVTAGGTPLAKESQVLALESQIAEMTAQLISTAVRPKYIGVYENSGAPYMDICIDKSLVYLAKEADGVQALDCSNPLNPTPLMLENTVISGMESNAIIKDGNYLYVASSTASDTYADDPVVSMSFTSGLSDISSGGDGWGSGSKATGVVMVGNSEKSPFGLYSAKVSFSSLAGNAWGYIAKSITGGVNNYAMLWIKVTAPIANDMTAIRFNIFGDGSNYGYDIALQHHAAGYFNMQMGLYDNVHALQTVDASVHLQYGTWYLIKAYYKIDSTSGGGTLSYKANIADDWTQLASKLNMNTNGKTPTLLKVGLSAKPAGSTYTTGSINFNEVMFDTTDLDSKAYEEGRVDCLSASDLSIIDTVFFNSKCSDIFKLGNWLLVAMKTRGFAVVDATTPTSLQFIGFYGDYTGNLISANAVGGFTVGANKYAAIANNDRGLLILNITNPTNITLVSAIDFSESSSVLRDIYVEYPYIYGTKCLSSSTDEGTSNDHRGLVVYDVTNVATPIKYEFQLPSQEKPTFTTGDVYTRPGRIAKNENIVYIANGIKGVAIYDASNPINATYVGSLRTPSKYNESIWCVSADEFGRVFIGGGKHINGNHYLYQYQ